LRPELEEIIDRLYGLPPGEFTRARNEAAGELRKAGQREAAERVKTLRKPTAVAAAVNRLVREHRGAVEKFLSAAATLRDVQLSGTGSLAGAVKRERAEVEGLIRIGGEAVRQTLLAAAADDDAAQQLLEARLVRELEPRGFGTLLAHARPPDAEALTHARSAAAVPAQARSAAAEHAQARSAAAGPLTHARPVAAEPAGATAPQPKPPPPERKKPDDSAARARLEEAKAALRAAEAEERQTRRRWKQTQHELEKARSAFEEAQRHLDRLHSR
jgi:hypothetical protein